MKSGTHQGHLRRIQTMAPMSWNSIREREMRSVSTVSPADSASRTSLSG